jgi:hypothetical protein
MDSNLLYNPLNIINGNTTPGPIILDCYGSLKREPTQKPMLLPTNAALHNTNTEDKKTSTVSEEIGER